MEKNKLGRPKKSFKYGSVNCFQYRKIQSKINTLKEIRRQIISDIKKEIVEAGRINRFVEKVERELK